MLFFWKQECIPDGRIIEASEVLRKLGSCSGKNQFKQIKSDLPNFGGERDIPLGDHKNKHHGFYPRPHLDAALRYPSQNQYEHKENEIVKSIGSFSGRKKGQMLLPLSDKTEPTG